MAFELSNGKHSQYGHSWDFSTEVFHSLCSSIDPADLRKESCNTLQTELFILCLSSTAPAKVIFP